MADLSPRIIEARDLLARAVELYRRARPLLLHIPGIPRGGRTGKPRSRPPAGVDASLRAALIASARALAYGHHLAADLACPGEWWDTTRDPALLGSWWIPRGIDRCAWSVEVRDVAGEATLVLRASPDRPHWTPDADDTSLRPPTPADYAWAARRLAAGLGWAASYDLDVRQLCHQAKRAVWHLTHIERVRMLDVDDHGEWQVLEVWRGADAPADYPAAWERCSHWPGCYRLRDGGHRLCSECRRRRAGDCRACQEVERAVAEGVCERPAWSPARGVECCGRCRRCEEREAA